MEKLQGKWLIAVSSGPDSMALLQMCIDAGIDCAVAHVNYHHRPEADEEENYIRSFCVERGISIFVHNDPFVYTGNFEAAARELRYRFFVEIVRREGLQGVLIGHHQDDLLETYIMQESKNIVPEYYGLREEMLMHGVLFKRPLLQMTKEELVTYCKEHELRYYIDVTNLSDEYTRNQIRHQIVEPMTPFERSVYLREIKQKNAIMQERRCRVKTYIRQDKILLATYRALAQEDRVTMLRMFVEKTPHYSLKHLQGIDETIMHACDFIIPLGEFSLVSDGTYLLKYVSEKPYCYVFESMEELQDIRKEHFYTENGRPGVFALTLEEADFPIQIRSFQAGDKIQMRFGCKEVHRFFIDRHIPQYQRQTWPVVENAAGEIILVPGLGCNVQHYSTMPNLNVIQY